MTSPPDSALRYRYDFDPQDDSVAARALRMVGAEKEVLEVGCAAGSMSRVLSGHYRCRVTGVERDPQAAAEAQPWCERIVVADLDAADWSAALGESCFDVVLAADVIEHLRDPLACLRELRARLRPGGRLVLSVPNVGYMGVIASLIAGEFEYRATGLLDHTHLRFFTWISLQRLLHAAGFAVLHSEAVETSNCHGDFTSCWARLPEALQQHLQALPHARVYQYVVMAEAAGMPVALIDEDAQTARASRESAIVHADPVQPPGAVRLLLNRAKGAVRLLRQGFVAMKQH